MIDDWSIEYMLYRDKLSAMGGPISVLKSDTLSILDWSGTMSVGCRSRIERRCVVPRLPSTRPSGL